MRQPLSLSLSRARALLNHRANACSCLKKTDRQLGIFSYLFLPDGSVFVARVNQPQVRLTVSGYF
jgi:hypothetical protein